jgi:putative transposase
MNAFANVRRVMIGAAAGQLITTGIGALTGAADREKSAERWAQCHGCCDPGWQAWVATVEFRISRLRDGNYFLGFVEPWRIAEATLTNKRLQYCLHENIRSRTFDRSN